MTIAILKPPCTHHTGTVIGSDGIDIKVRCDDGSEFEMSLHASMDPSETRQPASGSRLRFRSYTNNGASVADNWEFLSCHELELERAAFLGNV